MRMDGAYGNFAGREVMAAVLDGALALAWTAIDAATDRATRDRLISAATR
jgi:hypothetical protein